MKASMVCFLPSDFPDHFLITGRKDKAPLEKVKNLLDTLAQMIDACHRRAQSISDAKPKITFPGLETPVNRNIAKLSTDYEASVMKGVVFTATGEALATPKPAELTNLFANFAYSILRQKQDRNEGSGPGESSTIAFYT